MDDVVKKWLETVKDRRGKQADNSVLSRFARDIFVLKQDGCSYKQIRQFLAEERKTVVTPQMICYYYNKHIKRSGTKDKDKEEPAPKQTPKEEPQKEERQIKTAEELKNKEATNPEASDILEGFNLPTERVARIKKLDEIYESKFHKEEVKNAIKAEIKRLETKEERSARLNAIAKNTLGETWGKKTTEYI